MQCRLPKKQTKYVDVALSGTFDRSYGYVTIDGTKYTSEQTLTVAKGTSVMVFCYASTSTFMSQCKITFNETIVAKGSSGSPAQYNFTATDNCSVYISYTGSWATAAITMPA